MKQINFIEDEGNYKESFENCELIIENMAGSFMVVFNEYSDSEFIPCQELYEFKCQKKTLKCNEENCPMKNILKNGEVKVTRTLNIEKSESLSKDLIIIKELVLSVLKGENIAEESDLYYAEDKIIKHYSNEWMFDSLGFCI